MANSILKLRVESSEYDAKLKKAAEGIRHLAEVAHRGGGDLTGLEKAELDYIKALGDMETKSRSASGKVRELSNAYKELTVTYNELNDVEKADEGGKALAASLEKLRARAQEAQAQMDVATKSLQSNTSAGNEDSGMLSKLADKFTINIDAIKLFNVGLNAAKAALDVAKDAFFASEQNVDEWAGVVAASESVYEGFLTAINNGDISGYLGRIDQIVKAAREAYNELDRLGTMKTIQAPSMSKQEAENNRMRMMIMTGRYIAPADGRKASMANGTLLSPEQIRSIEQKLQNGMKTITSLTKNELDQTGRAIDAYYKKLAVQNGMSLSEFRQGTSSMAEFDKRVAGARKYDEWQMAHSYVDQSTGRLIAPRTGNPYAQYAGWNNFRVDKQGPNSYNDLVNLIKQQQQQTNQLYSTMGQAYRTINRAEGVTVRGLMGGSGSGGSGGGGGRAGGGGPSMPKNVRWDNYIDKVNLGAEELKGSDIKETMSVWATMSDEAKKSMLGLAEATEDLGDAQAKLGNENVTDEIAQRVKLLDQQNKAMNMAAQAANNFGAALAGLDDPSARAAGTVIQAIANITLGFSQAAAQAGSMGPWGWLAYVAAGAGALATTISTIHSLTGYAQGGMVEGNKYSGDQIPAMLNAGELVLTKAMQGNLASQLQGNGGGGRGGYTPSHVSGEQIWIALNAFTKRTGKGEVVTWR